MAAEVHPTATVYDGTVLGEGVKILENAVVGKQPALGPKSTASREPLPPAEIGAGTIVSTGAIVFAGFYAPKAGAWEQPGMNPAQLEAATFPGFAPSLGVALVLILYTYGGWNDAAFVAAEVRNGKKNIARALILG